MPPMLRSVLAGLVLCLGVTAPAYTASIDEAVLAKLNRVRANPAAFADELRTYRSYFRGDEVHYPGGPIEITNEGRRAVDEAIAFLERQKPLPPLSAEAVLIRSAFDHVKDQGRSGRVGHSGSDGSGMSERIRRYGQWHGSAAENISYGQGDAASVVRQLIVDDGIADRGHRNNIFDPNLKSVGVACGPHRTWGAMCVMDMAGTVTGGAVAREVASEYGPLGEAVRYEPDPRPDPRYDRYERQVRYDRDARRRRGEREADILDQLSRELPGRPYRR